MVRKRRSVAFADNTGLDQRLSRFSESWSPHRGQRAVQWLSGTAQHWVRYRRPASLRPAVVLSAEWIRIWDGRRFTDISIGDIAGVGMLYAKPLGSAVGYWRLYIWQADGTAVPTSFCQSAPVRELPALDEARQAAKVTRDITERVLAAQGPKGQLRTHHFERVENAVWLDSSTRVLAYWGGDGTTRPCRP